MKTVVIILLCSLLLIEGCTTSSLLSREERAKLRALPEDRIEIVLRDGSKIEAEPYHYIEVMEPSDFVFGVGERWDNTTGKRSSFWGKIHPISVDSSDTTYNVYGHGVIRLQFYDYLLSDGSRVRFESSECFTVTSKQGAGIWCTGSRELNGSTSMFTGRIPTEKVVSIKAIKVEPTTTFLLVLGSSILVFVHLWHRFVGDIP